MANFLIPGYGLIIKDDGSGNNYLIPGYGVIVKQNTASGGTTWLTTNFWWDSV